PKSRTSPVRVKFASMGGWYTSKIGKDALKIPKPNPTVHLEWLKDKSGNVKSKMMKRHILHEFGHVLGAEHEHFSPDFLSMYKWNRHAVINHYIAQVDSQVQARSKANTNIFRKLDPT